MIILTYHGGTEAIVSPVVSMRPENYIKDCTKNWESWLTAVNISRLKTILPANSLPEWFWNLLSSDKVLAVLP